MTARRRAPPVTGDEAFAILEPYFLAVRTQFVEQAPRVKKVQLDISRQMHDTARHFAGWSGRAVLASPEMVHLPEETVLAILSHEFGHAVDFLYPGAYVLVDGEGLVHQGDVAGSDKRAEQARVAIARRWEKRDDDTVERTADAIAEMVLGRSIGYSGPCLLQTFGPGVRPRPEGLK